MYIRTRKQKTIEISFILIKIELSHGQVGKRGGFEPKLSLNGSDLATSELPRTLILDTTHKHLWLRSSFGYCYINTLMECFVKHRVVNLEAMKVCYVSFRYVLEHTKKKRTFRFTKAFTSINFFARKDTEHICYFSDWCWSGWKVFFFRKNKVTEWTRLPWGTRTAHFQLGWERVAQLPSFRLPARILNQPQNHQHTVKRKTKTLDNRLLVARSKVFASFITNAHLTLTSFTTTKTKVFIR